MGFPLGDPRQRPHQGALLCGDWPGPEKWEGEIPERFYLAGEHLGADADVAGMMLFCFACYGAGTPRHDDFGRGRGFRGITITAKVGGAMNLLSTPQNAEPPACKPRVRTCGPTWLRRRDSNPRPGG